MRRAVASKGTLAYSERSGGRTPTTSNGDASDDDGDDDDDDVDDMGKYSTMGRESIRSRWTNGDGVGEERGRTK